MSLYSYLVFSSVAEQRSFIGAAEQLIISPSAVSHQITKLEEKLGLPLFERLRTGVKLTADGERLLPYIREILNAEECVVQLASSINGLSMGRLRIGTVNSICTNWLPQIIESFRAQNPDIEVSVCEGGYDDELRWLRTGFADLALTSETVMNEDFDFVPLFVDKMVCVTHKSFIPANGEYVDADDIRNQKIIFQHDGYNAETLAVLRRLDLQTSVSDFAVSSDNSIVALIECGLGISILPTLVLNKIIHDVRVYPFRPEMSRVIGVATLKKRMLSPAVKAVRNHVMRFFAKMELENTDQ